MIQIGLKQQRKALRKYDENEETNIEQILDQEEEKEAVSYSSNANEAVITEANFIHLVSEVFLNTFLQFDIRFKRQEIEGSSENLSKNSQEDLDQTESKVKFKNNKFDIKTVIKHIGKRNKGLASQKRSSALTPDELSTIDEEIQNLKQMGKELRKGNSSVVYKIVPELTQLTISKLKLEYGFITWKDRIQLGNVIKNLLLELNYIERSNRGGRSSTIQPSSYFFQHYDN